MAGGTTFHFLSATPDEALERALDAADGKDVRVGGGATVAREFLKAGLVDQLHLAIAPISCSDAASDSGTTYEGSNPDMR